MTAAQRRAAIRRRNRQWPVVLSLAIAVACLAAIACIRGGL